MVYGYVYGSAGMGFRSVLQRRQRLWQMNQRGYWFFQGIQPRKLLFYSLPGNHIPGPVLRGPVVSRVEGGRAAGVSTRITYLVLPACALRTRLAIAGSSNTFPPPPPLCIPAGNGRHPESGDDVRPAAGCGSSGVDI